MIKKNIILKEYGGTWEQIDCSDLIKKNVKGFTFLHGHPTVLQEAKGATPLSLADVLTCLTNRLGKMTAYNKNGEFNTIEKKPDGWFRKLLPNSILNISDFFKNIVLSRTLIAKYVKCWSSIFPK